MTTLPPIAVAHPSDVGAARRAAAELAAALGLEEQDVARVALVATEMATNLVKHAHDGVLLLQPAASEQPAVELIALDRGPGIAEVARALQDGVSSAGTSGTGLGAIRRAATRFDVHSTSAGTAVLAVVAPAAAATPASSPRFAAGGVCVPYPGEAVCGDALHVVAGEGRTVAMVVDGLGHGPLAAAAAARACELFAAHHRCPPGEIVERWHAGMRATRGAAGAVAEIDAGRGVVRFCGVGNVAATIVSGGTTRSLVSHHGTLGHDARRIAEFQYPWPAASTLVMNSDGLVSHWTLARYPGLAERAPSLVAAVLYRDHRRARDDAAVLVLRQER